MPRAPRCSWFGAGTLGAVVVALLLRTVAAEPADELAAGFEQPPDAARPLTWWHWMDAYVTKEGITADLEAMKRAGLGGAQMFSVWQVMNYPDRRGTVKGDADFMSPRWRQLVQHAVTESHRLGLEFSILTCEGWGQAGGLTVPPHENMQMVVWSKATVTGGKIVPLVLDRPVPEPRYYEDIAVLAFPAAPGDDQPSTPAITASATIPGKPPASSMSLPPVLVMPLPMPTRPQWVRLDFAEPRAFSSLFLAMNDMRDVEDPERWENSPYIDAATKDAVRALPGPHYWELQASDDGQEFRPVARVATHGTSSFPEMRSRHFRIWMPVPPPLQKQLPLAAKEIMEITGISLGGPRLDRPETRVGQYVDSNAKEFSGRSVPPANVIQRSAMLDLTGRKEWTAPPGNWTILRIGHAATGIHIAAAAIGGLEVDKLSREAVMHHLTQGMLSTVLADNASLVGTTLKNIVCDSWERGYENWTPRMREEFQRRRGYALDPWLPALTGQVVESVEASERFLWDFRRTIADLLAENYYGTMQDFAHARNMRVFAEATGHGLPTIADQLLCKGRTDVPMGEFWVGSDRNEDPKEAASAAHIYGQNIAGAESFTARPGDASWTKDPFMLKAGGDLRFCAGINCFCFHRYAHQPWLDKRPGMSMGQWGTNFDRTNTWWDEIGPWIDYLTRCQYMLRRGRFVADLCYFYGEDAPMDFGYDQMKPGLPTGFDFDVCNADILLRMAVHEGRIILPSGMSYRVLVLPQNDRMSPTVLRTVQRLVREGATVVGPRPEKSPSLMDYPACDESVRTIAADVWGDCDGRTKTEHRYGAGRVIWGGSLAAALGAGPDFSGNDDRLRYIHRRDGDTEIYFVSNQAAEEKLAMCTFRVGGLVPELWHPDTGRRETCAMYSIREGQTTLPIHFDPAGSVFVVFRQPAKGGDPIAANPAALSGGTAAAVATSPPAMVNGAPTLTVWANGTFKFDTARGRSIAVTVDDVPAPFELSGPWRVTFPSGLGAPAAVTFDRLRSWTEETDDGVKYFSGTATYVKDFTLPAVARNAARRYFLDLGQVKNLCRVRLNGKELGILWKPPFRVEIGEALRDGTNHLEVEVTNLWPNRMIGDQKLPVEKRIAWATYNPFKESSPLLISGLLGPVRIQTAKEIVLHP